MADIEATCGESAMMLWLQLVLVNEKMQHHAGDHLECYDLTPAQYDVLAQLHAAPGITQQALASRLMVTKGNICGLIDRLERRDFVERRVDPEDRRSNLLYLTEVGKKIAETAVPAYGQFVVEHMARLSDSEKATLGALLSKLEQSLDHH
jgi:DNA-binding MarR family transcriptional regulator